MKRTQIRNLVILLFLFSVFMFVYLKHYIHEGNPPNRVALCLALIEDGSVIIDKYYHFTSDHCLRDGHYYCDKAPGASFLALPFVATAFYGLQFLGETDFTSYDPTEKKLEPNVNFKLLMLAGSLAVSLPCALAIALFYRLCLYLGMTNRIAFFAALILGFGTPFGVWATFMIGHSLAGAFLIFSVFFTYRLLHKESTARKDGAPADRLWGWCGVGFLLAYAVWVEYTAAVSSIAIGLLILYLRYEPRKNFLDSIRTVPWLMLGALPIALGFFYYNQIAFGSPLEVGYKYDATNFPLMDEGFYGIRFPDANVLFQTLFSRRHGLIWFSPILFFSPFLAVGNIVSGRHRALNVLCLVVPIYYFLLNSSYAYWMQSDIPVRHATASFPLLVLPIVIALAHASTALARTLKLFALASIFFCFIAINVPCMNDYWYCNIPSFFLVADFFRGGMKNLLYYAGVNPYLSLVPEIVVIAVFVLLAKAELARVDNTDFSSESIQ